MSTQNPSCGAAVTSREIMRQTEEYVLHTYNRFPVVFDHGEGVTLYDHDGKAYLDFAAGIAVYALGYGNEKLNGAIKDQVDRLVHTSNLFYHKPLWDAAERLVKKSGMAKVFFGNSGAEAIEGAIKAARKYAYLRDGNTDHEIVAMNSSFHGRSIGALSVTGNAHYREAFGPLMGGVRFADFNDYDSVLAAVTDKTCAIIMETVQGEGGIYPADPAFLQKVRALCDERDILLILDEIQCGMGRCGDWFACQGYGVAPDIMTVAKALGCGVPVGAFLVNEKVAKASLVPGDHGTTYGGNPLACRAAAQVMDIFEEEDIIGHVRAITPFLEKKLDEVAAASPIITARRGKGLMQGLVVKDVPVGQIVGKALENGLVILSAGADVLRFVPPLIITEADIDRMAQLLMETLQSFAH